MFLSQLRLSCDEKKQKYTPIQKLCEQDTNFEKIIILKIMSYLHNFWIAVLRGSIRVIIEILCLCKFDWFGLYLTICIYVMLYLVSNATYIGTSNGGLVWDWNYLSIIILFLKTMRHDGVVFEIGFLLEPL